MFLTSDPDVGARRRCMHNLKHNHVLHDRNVIVTVDVATTPRVADAERVDDRAARRRLLADAAELRLHGEPNVPKALALGAARGARASR